LPLHAGIAGSSADRHTQRIMLSVMEAANKCTNSMGGAGAM